MSITIEKRRINPDNEEDSPNVTIEEKGPND